MITKTSLDMSQSPKTYIDLLNYFDVLKAKNVNKDVLKLLSRSKCHVPEPSVAILQDELIKTLNIMLNRCIKDFKKNLQMSLDYSEYENIYNVFIDLAIKIESCLFFSEFSFLGEKFINELSDSFEKQAKVFWCKTINLIYQQCIEDNNLILEDELYMIKRIHLFGVKTRVSCE
ncbi:MAG: hypothetical protein R3Y27_04765 [Clostridia bacterium]